MRFSSVPITFETVQSVVSVKENDDITIPCEVYGLPEPTIQWYFNELNLAEKLSSKFMHEWKGKLNCSLKFSHS